MGFNLKLYGKKKDCNAFFSVIALNFVMQIEVALGTPRDLRKVEAWLK